MKNSQKIRVAVIGAGNMGKNHLRNYFILPESDLVGLADINPVTKKLADEYNTEFYTDYKEMLDEINPDAVSIVVPTPFHFEVASEVMSRGIHCMLEKPIASTVDEANKLIDIAKKNKVVFTVGHIEHYNPLVVKLKELLDKKTVGEVTSIVCKRVGGFPAVEPKTDVILDLAVHDIGIITYLLGESPKSVYSHGSRTHHSKQNDSAEILLDYGRASGFIQANWLTPIKIRTIAVTGSKGYIEGNYITQELVSYVHNMQKSVDDFSGFVIKMGEPQKDIIKVDFEEPLQVELKRFMAHIGGDNGGYLVSASEATNALEFSLTAASTNQERKT